MKLAEVKEMLSENVSLRNGIFTYRVGFFYTNGCTSQRLVDRVLKTFPNAVIVGHAEIWKPFRGGVSVAQQSHWYVKFMISEEPKRLEGMDEEFAQPYVEQ